MSAASPKSKRGNSRPTINATSSPASAGGPKPSGLPSGAGQSGQAHVHASHLASLEPSREPPTSATSGPSSCGSSASAALQLSLESRLRASLDVNGSPEYVLTWKTWDMLSGPPICALRASARRTSDSGSTGWASPKANNNTGAGTRGEGGENLQTQALMVSGYPSPSAGNGNGSQIPTAGTTTTGKRPNGTKATVSLNHVALQVSGYNSPRATDGSNGGPNQGGGALSHDVHQVAGYPTAAARDWKSSASNLMDENSRPLNEVARAAFGGEGSSFHVSTGKRGALNPAFSLWLMGFPIVWALCGALVTLSSRKSRHNS